MRPRYVWTCSHCVFLAQVDEYDVWVCERSKVYVLKSSDREDGIQLPLKSFSSKETIWTNVIQKAWDLHTDPSVSPNETYG